MALLSLAMGAQAGLDDRAIEAGQILVTTDTARMYVDVSNTSRIALNANIAEKVRNTLSINVNGTAFKSFNGSTAPTINFVGGKNVTLTASGNDITIKSADIPTALPNPAALKWGNQTYTGATEKTITLADFGLTNVLHFLGTTTTAIDDGNTTRTISVGGKSVTANSGDIVMYNGAEFIWTSSAWEKLGDEALWVPNTRKVIAGTKLVGDYTTLSNDITISHANIKTTAPTSTSGLFVKNIITDGYGHVTQWENADCKNLSLHIAGTLQTTYDPFNAAATFDVPLMGAASTSEAGTIGLVPAPTKGAITRVLAADGDWKSLIAGTGISVSGLTITNAGVRSIAKGSNGAISVNTNGASASVTVYTLPNATADTLGGVKIGSNITVTGGVISITGNNVRTAMGAATGTNSGYLSSTDFTTFTNAANAVVWGTF